MRRILFGHKFDLASKRASWIARFRGSFLLLGFGGLLMLAYAWGGGLQSMNGWGSLVILAAPFGLLARHLWRRNPDLGPHVKNLGSPDPSPSSLKPAFVLLVILTTSVLSFRYLSFPFPQGTDTPYYAFATSLMLEGRPDLIVGFSRDLTYVLIISVRVLMENVLGFSELNSFVVMPFIFASLLAVSFMYLVRAVSDDSELAAIASLVFATSGFFLRLTWDLYSAMLSFSMLCLFLGMFFQIQKSKNQPLGIAKLCVVNFLTLLSGTFIWLVGSVLFLILWLHQFYVLRNRKIDPTRFLAIISLPVAYLIVTEFLLSPLISVPSTWYERTTTPTFSEGFLYATPGFRPLSLPPSWNLVNQWENPFYVWFGAFSLLLILGVSNVRSRQLLLPWSIMFTALFLYTGYPDWFRLIPVLVATSIGTSAVFLRAELAQRLGFLQSTQISRIMHSLSPGLAKSLPTLMIIAAILPLSVFYASSSPFLHPATGSFPDREILNELYLMRNVLGWGNTQAVIVINRPSDAAFGWTRAIVGIDVYLGNLSAFIEGVPFSAAGVDRILIDPCLKTMAVVSSQLYSDFDQVQSSQSMGNLKIISLPTC